MNDDVGSGLCTRPAATFSDYVAIARPDHWIKHLFMVPGAVIAFALSPVPTAFSPDLVLIGFGSAAAIASANYVINEWLDARFDAFHPLKSRRPAVRKAMSPAIVYGEYAMLAASGLALAAAVGPVFLTLAGLFLLSGVAYNVAPLRTKDRPYLDVLNESFNNPLRLALGWTLIDGSTLPPSSLFIAYWSGGAYLMAVKRYSEYRTAQESESIARLGLYRRSFRFYSEKSLLASSFLYAQMAAFFLAVFLIKYRTEYLLSLPLFAALFTFYLWVSLKPNSAAQAPEKLFRERGLMACVAVLVVALAALTVIDIPAVEALGAADYTALRFR